MLNRILLSYFRGGRDFENPYEQIPPDFPAYDEYGGADMGGAGYDDYVEDISDNEVWQPKRC